MSKTMYVVSYVSYCEEIYNNVRLVNNKAEAIKSANAYVDDVNESVHKDFVTTDNFNNYELGYTELKINDYHRGHNFLISITQFDM